MNESENESAVELSI